MKRPLDELIEIARMATLKGSEVLKTSRPQVVTEKSDRDTFTDVDLRIERDLRDHLAHSTPEIGFAGEEEGSILHDSTSPFWSLDPIDGTANFVHRVPLSAVQLTLIYKKKAIVTAISLPFLEMHYWAAVGRGAYMNNDRIHVSDTGRLSKSIIAIGDYATGIGSSEKNRQRIAITARLAERVERVRMFGSAAHDFAWFADGRIDGVIIMSNNSIDIAGGVLLAREAGGIVTDASGVDHSHDSTSTVAVNKALSTEIMDLMKAIQEEPESR